MKYLTSGMDIPCYMVFPRFLLTLGIGETPMLLYVVLLDRARLSLSNPMWTDEDGRVFLCYPIRDMAAVLHKGESAIKDALNALERSGLIVRKRQGIGQPNRIYVRFPADEKAAVTQSENQPAEGEKTTVRAPENRPSDRQKTGCLMVGKPAGNKNNILKTTEQKRGSKNAALGSFQNVFLTVEELDELRRTVPGFEDYIERLSSYMASSGKTYQNHAATIKSWYLRDYPRAPVRSYECAEGESL